MNSLHNTVQSHILCIIAAIEDIPISEVAGEFWQTCNTVYKTKQQEKRRKKSQQDKNTFKDSDAESDKVDDYLITMGTAIAPKPEMAVASLSKGRSGPVLRSHYRCSCSSSSSGSVQIIGEHICNIFYL